MPHLTAAAQRLGDGDAHWRSNLENFLTTGGGRKGWGGVDSTDYQAGVIDDEFGTDSSTESPALEAEATGSEVVEDKSDLLLETAGGDSAVVEDISGSERGGEWEEDMGYYALGECPCTSWLGGGGRSYSWLPRASWLCADPMSSRFSGQS